MGIHFTVREFEICFIVTFPWRAVLQSFFTVTGESVTLGDPRGMWRITKDDGSLSLYRSTTPFRFISLCKLWFQGWWWGGGYLHSTPGEIPVRRWLRIHDEKGGRRCLCIIITRGIFNLTEENHFNEEVSHYFEFFLLRKSPIKKSQLHKTLLYCPKWGSLAFKVTIDIRIRGHLIRGTVPN